MKKRVVHMNQKDYDRIICLLVNTLIQHIETFDAHKEPINNESGKSLREGGYYKGLDEN